jgi:uncharacterized membrane protein YedE/YeeE
VIAQSISPSFVFGQVKLFESSLLSILLAGFLVGFGTQLGNGCTSGHGLCGLPRLSIRSIINTFAFLGVGMLMASLSRLSLPNSLFGLDGSKAPFPDPADSSALFVEGVSSLYNTSVGWWTWGMLGLAVLLLALALYHSHSNQSDMFTEQSPLNTASVQLLVDDFQNSTTDVLVSLLLGIVFGTGLCFSGMTDPHRVSEFLDLNPAHGWDPQLLLVLGAGVTVNFIAFRFILARPAPVLCTKFSVPSDTRVTVRLVIGGCLFGVGWGMCGICPGPMLVALSSGRAMFPIFGGALIVGIYAFVLLDKHLPF